MEAVAPTWSQRRQLPGFFFFFFFFLCLFLCMLLKSPTHTLFIAFFLNLLPSSSFSLISSIFEPSNSKLSPTMATRGKNIPKRRSKSNALPQDNFRPWFPRNIWDNSDLLLEINSHVCRHTSELDNKVFLEPFLLVYSFFFCKWVATGKVGRRWPLRRSFSLAAAASTFILVAVASPLWIGGK